VKLSIIVIKALLLNLMYLYPMHASVF
jgi:hypothetical protein